MASQSPHPLLGSPLSLKPCLLPPISSQKQEEETSAENEFLEEESWPLEPPHSDFVGCGSVLSFCLEAEQLALKPPAETGAAESLQQDLELPRVHQDSAGGRSTLGRWGGSILDSEEFSMGYVNSVE